MTGFLRVSKTEKSVYNHVKQSWVESQMLLEIDMDIINSSTSEESLYRFYYSRLKGSMSAASKSCQAVSA